ncbi:polyadenylate-binding protein 2-like isoform X2 [Populus nigra]|uniref:polyadenylate-binding protein 2-like isoform X2 n=1 Tax=Populus nigra TaxID=3691 RepID=UPI002B277460|nr:polyadenylate-binding protein 2-like isoform X2 [Populus nigra]
MTGGVTGHGNIQPESRKLERPTRTMHEAHAANNIRRKRHFGEICTDQDALAGCSRKELQCLDFSQFSKRSNMIKEDSKATPNLISEVLDVKQKLHKIELEMSKLRLKQVEMEKDGKSNLLSCSDGKIHAEEDTKMRTVFVTNVHFAATKEALSLYFTKCGVVENVVILTDKTTGQRKGSAYVAFASKDSAEKAVALSGATFFSRTLKVHVPWWVRV